MNAGDKTGVLDGPLPAGPSDALTVASLAVLAYAIANVLHEAVGHGGACLLVGGAPQLWTSASFECGTDNLPLAADQIVAAAGTIVNLAAGSVALVLWRRGAPRGPATRFFLWLFATINLLVGFGYFAFSGLGRIGDWADVMAPVRPEWLWRIGLGAGGFALYWITTRYAFAALADFIGGLPSDRFPIGRRLALVSYVSGAVLYCVAGMLNPGGPRLLLISSAAASLGGTSGLWWGTNFLRRGGGAAGEAPARIRRDMRIVAGAAVAAVIYIRVLGPGLRL